MTDGRTPAPSSDASDAWTSRAPSQIVLLLVVYFLGVFVFPARFVLAAFLTSLAAAIVLFGSDRWSSQFDALFGARLPLPGWAVSTAAVSCLLFGALVFTERFTPAGALYAVVTGFSATWLVGLAVGGDARRLVSARRRVPLWLGGPTVLLVAAASYAFAGHLPSVFDAAVFFGLLMVSAIVVVVLPLTFVQRRRFDERDVEPPCPSVSVLVPAYNEEGYVGQCIEAVLESDYPTDALEVVVVDDGSTDGTYEEAAAYRGENVTVLSRTNGGKHGALNFALSCARGDVVVAVDADSVVEPTAISRAVGALQSDDDVGAVAGTVKVGNRDGHLARMQALEYAVGINTLRRAFALFDSVMVVPGCFGAFRREALDDVGGYDPDTVAEDFDLTVRLLQAGWHVRTTEGVVTTEAPFSLGDLYRQRLRWTRGNIQSLVKHRDVFFDPDCGYLHRFAFPWFALSLVFVPLSSAVVTVAIGLAILDGRLLSVLAATLYFVSLFALIAAVAIDISGEDWSLLAYVPVHLVGYRQFLDVVVFSSVLDAVRRTDDGWESVTRLRQTGFGDSAADD
ncbi:Glycosyltransferase, catalytic subunit of cellulose synthase and poly-beta-1,6-N-acetylglucosamine synthase [Halopelagius inordinatus]|uniref:Glycosyltransferase, catalytic subunit of cellulose synthase and poly-beta-1,6-N-acetylglucosamine synthase n=1 Tax=Halopelagius inordinatus TaxID=553467 RepID=A0A1I2WGB7_9EURY|nr:glycosyltransferase family 2 protein [Halopelagius inordinatus]SFH00390.1 Glycosyltransferase, catalytic subunit of cellulose synthase and poly-beta-1,6-N-acetylglucosamine synthase [Halopelagius inordinatus]